MISVDALMEKPLPPGWIWKTMGGIADVVSGGTPKTSDASNFDNGDVPWLTPADLSGYTQKHVSRGARLLTQKGLQSCSAKLLPAGSVLFTSRAPIGYVAIAANPIATNQGFKNFVLRGDVLPEYVYWWLKGSKQLAESLASGTTFLEISGTNAKKLPIPIAPPDQQREIVAEIEKQFSRLDEAVANLQRVKANLKRYKAAVLKAAVEGRLVETEAELARREGRTYESGKQLIERIFEERRIGWQGRGPFKAPVSPAESNLPDLPSGWTWAAADQVCSQITDGEHIQPRYQDVGYPMLTAKNVRDGYVEFENAGLIADDDFQNCLKRCCPVEGDVLVVSVGATTGRAAIVGPAKPFALVRSVLLLKPLILSRYLLSVIQSSACQTYIQRASGSTAQAHLYIKDTRSLPVPLPPIAEQNRIVAEVDRRLSIVHEVEAEVEANLQRAQALRQSVLRRCFGAC